MKVCPSGHPNVRGSAFCGMCGSPDLSMPQPRLPGFVPLVYAFSIFLLSAASFAYLFIFARALLTDPGGLLKPMLVGLAIGLLWLGVAAAGDTQR